jgi:hypothetical protein
LPSIIDSRVIFRQDGQITPDSRDRNGHLILNVDQATSRELKRFKTVFGDGVLRRTVNGIYQVKLYERSQIFDIGRTEGVLINDVSNLSNVTYLTLRIPRPGCDYVYRLMVNAPKAVYKNDLPNECSVPLHFAAQGDSWLAVQQKPQSARFWLISSKRVQSGYGPDEPVVAVQSESRVLGPSRYCWPPPLGQHSRQSR